MGNSWTTPVDDNQAATNVYSTRYTHCGGACFAPPFFLPTNLMRPNTLLLPIHPRHAAAIYAGRKAFEFRKFRPCNEFINQILLYETASIKRITGLLTFEYGEIYSASKEWVWAHCHRSAGITRQEFFQYFATSSIAHAYPILSIEPFTRPQTLTDLGLTHAPQNRQYIAYSPH